MYYVLQVSPPWVPHLLPLIDSASQILSPQAQHAIGYDNLYFLFNIIYLTTFECVF